MAARVDHVDAFESLFSRERWVHSDETRASFLQSMLQAEEVTELDVLELVLDSHAFCHALTDDQRQDLLDTVLSRCKTPENLSLAIAHGARVNDASPTMLGHAPPNALAGHGAFLVGARLPETSYYAYPDLEALAALGIDGIEMVLLDAAEHADAYAVDQVLALAPFDVDARSADGATAFMRLASFDMSLHISSYEQVMDNTPEIAQALLEFCDVDLVDFRGRSVLHFAAANNLGIAEALLGHGVNPDVRDVDGLAPVDYLPDSLFENRACHDYLKLLLDFGVDPFATPPQPPHATTKTRSLYDRLVETEAGRNFIRIYAHLLER